MKRVENNAFQTIKPFFQMAADVANQATCTKAKCGSVIVKEGKVIGSGYNSPALNDEGQRLCSARMDVEENPKYDKTCCIHAEWRAILDACKTNPEAILGSTLYFMRTNKEGAFTDAGEPFCTVCSRLTMESGIAEFALYNENGADLYQADEYNLKSYQGYLLQ